MLSEYRSYLIGFVLLLAGAFGLLGLQHKWIEQGRAEVRAEYTKKIEKLTLEYETAQTVSRDRYSQTLAQLREEHEQRTTKLQQALDASGLRNVHLSRELARMHDAATGSWRPPSDPESPEHTSEGAEDTTGIPSVAELIEVVDENYSICRQNSSQLVELQNWYNDLRARSIRVIRD